ncbi:MAG TPA: hypothetical protein VFW15_08045, partial [Thermoanaerobaculia bacterium]|nr:hypothetical protein [Thermoanaerobaculia bacterium]
AQAAFVRGVAQLHNFESEDAVAAFVAQKADPDFALPAGDAEAANRIASRLRAIRQRGDAKSGTR